MGKRGFTLLCSFSYSFVFIADAIIYLLEPLDNNILSTLLTLCFKYKNILELQGSSFSGKLNKKQGKL